jgi:hypothetical protein
MTYRLYQEFLVAGFGVISAMRPWPPGRLMLCYCVFKIFEPIHIQVTSCTPFGADNRHTAHDPDHNPYGDADSGHDESGQDNRQK